MRHRSVVLPSEPLGIVRTEAHRLVDRGDRFVGSIGEGERHSQNGVRHREVGALDLDSALQRLHGALAIAREQACKAKADVGTPHWGASAQHCAGHVDHLFDRARRGVGPSFDEGLHDAG